MLTSVRNSLVKQMRTLHQAKGRREQGLFLVEGTHLVEAACGAGREIATVCYTADWQTRYPDLWRQLTQQASRMEEVSPEVLRAIATTVEPDGIVATLERTTTPAPTFQQLGLVLETIQDPGNLGTMIRTVAAAGADGIMLSSDSVDLDHPKVLRASAGQWFQVPLLSTADLAGTLQQYRQQGFQIIATLPSATQVYWTVDFRSPTLLLMGNEGAGLSPNLAALADQAVKIPVSAGVESLNVAIAAALILYEAKRQHSQSLTGL